MDWKFRNKPIPPGQYIWSAEVTFIDGGVVNFNGQFKVIR